MKLKYALIQLHIIRLSFSILERIDVGETSREVVDQIEINRSFSILERIDVGETPDFCYSLLYSVHLSVSSNGSTWVKHRGARNGLGDGLAFSILERIDVGETLARRGEEDFLYSFSILERIDVGETRGGGFCYW